MNIFTCPYIPNDPRYGGNFEDEPHPDDDATTDVEVQHGPSPLCQHPVELQSPIPTPSPSESPCT